MTRSFCTLFDRNYLYQGVALYNSLVRHARSFTLYALCMDATAFQVIAKMARPNLVPISVDDLLTPDVASVRERTTHGQFCWVCQPLVCQFILDRFKVDMVTYLESDSLFFSDPEHLFEELGTRSASVVPHNFSAGFDFTESSGEFCVQFNAFRNDVAGREVLEHWRQNCFKYDKSAPLSYPGQTCLDEWPRLFECVAVIRHHGAGIAPWNIRGYKLEVREGTPHVDGVPAVFFHYHQYGRYKDGAHELGTYPMSPQLIDCFYRPYVDAIRKAEADVHAVDPAFGFRRQYSQAKALLDVLRRPSRTVMREYLRVLKRRYQGRCNIYPDRFFSDSRSGLR